MIFIVSKICSDGEFHQPNVTLYRLVRAPVPPFPGLTIHGENWQETIETVYFDEEKEQYEASPPREAHSPFSVAILEFLEMGWSKENPMPNKASEEA